MRIAIVGSHGVGKSTLAEELSKKLGYPILKDIVREEAIQKGFIINENTPPETQIWLVARQLELERNSGKNWIADKTLWDYFIYGEVVLKEPKVIEVIRYLVERNAKYDHIFYLPIEFPLEADGVRSPDPKFQKMIDERYRQYLEEAKINFKMISGSVEERVAQALKHLEA